MVKEIERAGIPAAHITNMVPVAKVMGSNRIIPGTAIKHPCGDINLPEQSEKEHEKKFVVRTLKAISTDIEEQTFF